MARPRTVVSYPAHGIHLCAGHQKSPPAIASLSQYHLRPDSLQQHCSYKLAGRQKIDRIENGDFFNTLLRTEVKAFDPLDNPGHKFRRSQVR